ncbi:hypothetical protein NC653_018124 [Populus alba x Populus x berolinensis]|uniref:Uncharacterized protein n=1 Tax=Populus alba x Populus x berolinensis TaxID=444605 RepID=A0AAD6QSH2_9ROSI|nr:hypothetical protein NC653_018124 [Populus alba x Populus x berolinensis]
MNWSSSYELGGDNRPPVCSRPSSSIGYFYEQALRASYPNADPRQIPEPMRNELILRRIEKERIREEIIAQEMAWRRELEAEVRRGVDGGKRNGNARRTKDVF